MNTAIIVTCYNRPEMLYVALERLYDCENIQNSNILVVEVRENDKPLEIQNQMKQVFNRFESRRNFEFFKFSHEAYMGENFFTMLKAVSGARPPADEIIIMEDDVMVERDMLRWTREIHNLFKPHFVLPTNIWMPRTDDANQVAISYSDYAHCIVSMKNSTVHDILRRNRIDKTPEQIFHNYILNGKRTVIFPTAPRALDAGWYGVRGGKPLGGSLEKKVEIIKEALRNPEISGGFIQPLKRRNFKGDAFWVIDRRYRWEEAYNNQARFGW